MALLRQENSPRGISSVIVAVVLISQSPEGSDEGWCPGQRLAAPRGQERQSRPALLREAHQEPPHLHRGAPPQTANSNIFTMSPHTCSLVAAVTPLRSPPQFRHTAYKLLFL